MQMVVLKKRSLKSLLSGSHRICRGFACKNPTSESRVNRAFQKPKSANFLDARYSGVFGDITFCLFKECAKSIAVKKNFKQNTIFLLEKFNYQISIGQKRQEINVEFGDLKGGFNG